MPRPRTDDVQVSGVDSLLHALRNPGRNIRQQFKDDPIGLAERLGLRLPEKPVFVMLRMGVITEEEAKERFGDDDGNLHPGIRDLIYDVCTLEVKSAVAVANRGGGKSNGVAFVETFLTFVLDFDALNLGGSELQADAVYSYIEGFVDATPEFVDLVKGEMLRSETNTTKGAWIRVLTASSKSVRSPHAGGRRRIPGSNPAQYRDAGGLLVIDEEAEADPDIVESALPTINTARPSVNIRCSTFHNIAGTFADVVENHEEMGYKLYVWDIFDVCEGCDCGPDGCESTETCFREDHYEEYTDPDTGQRTQRLLHRAYCGGRARYANGWIPMVEVESLWRRLKRNHARWEVEAMGSRPSASGHVIKDRKSYKKNRTDTAASELYRPGFPVTVCVDWGTIAAGVEVWQEWDRDRHALLHADLMEEAGLSQILGAILGYAQQYTLEFKEVAADIGGGGNYLNKALREEHGITTRDVNFGEEKEAAVAALNVYNEANKIILPNEFGDFHDQMMNWRRKNGRIEKKKDHMCDAAVCYFSAFIDRIGLTHLRGMMSTFTTASVLRRDMGPRTAVATTSKVVPATHRLPMIRTFGSR